MQVSSAIYIVMPIVIMAALGVMITLPFLVDSYSRRRSRRPLPLGAGEAPQPSPAGADARQHRTASPAATGGGAPSGPVPGPVALQRTPNACGGHNAARRSRAVKNPASRS